MNSETKQLLAHEGWTIECESPLEIRHEDGSFASQYAAKLVIQALCDEAVGHRARMALETVKGCAAIARQSCEGTMQALWVSIENECSKGLPD